LLASGFEPASALTEPQERFEQQVLSLCMHQALAKLGEHRPIEALIIRRQA